MSMQQNTVLIAVYHSINALPEDRIRTPNLVSPTSFEDHLRYYAAHMTVIALGDYLSAMRDGRALPKNSLVITFDDGYKDNLTCAYPLLQRYGFPATFFVASGYIGSGEMKWEDRLHCLIQRSRREAITVELPAGEQTFSIDSSGEKAAATDRLVNLLGHSSAGEIQRVLGQIEAQTGAACEADGLMMTWDDVRQLARTPGMTIGAHTITHRHLTRIPRDEAAREVRGSKEQIEEQIGQPVTTFSYPYGDFDAGTVEIVRTSGFECAGTIAYGKNGPSSDLFELKRVLIPDEQGRAFRFGLRLRSSVLGESLRAGYTLLKQLA